MWSRYFSAKPLTISCRWTAFIKTRVFFSSPDMIKLGFKELPPFSRQTLFFSRLINGNIFVVSNLISTTAENLNETVNLYQCNGWYFLSSEVTVISVKACGDVFEFRVEIQLKTEAPQEKKIDYSYIKQCMVCVNHFNWLCI